MIKATMVAAGTVALLLVASVAVMRAGEPVVAREARADAAASRKLLSSLPSGLEKLCNNFKNENVREYCERLAAKVGERSSAAAAEAEPSRKLLAAETSALCSSFRDATVRAECLKIALRVDAAEMLGKRAVRASPDSPNDAPDADADAPDADSPDDMDNGDNDNEEEEEDENNAEENNGDEEEEEVIDLFGDERKRSLLSVDASAAALCASFKDLTVRAECLRIAASSLTLEKRFVLASPDAPNDDNDDSPADDNNGSPDDDGDSPDDGDDTPAPAPFFFGNLGAGGAGGAGGSGSLGSLFFGAPAGSTGATGGFGSLQGSSSNPFGLKRNLLASHDAALLCASFKDATVRAECLSLIAKTGGIERLAKRAEPEPDSNSPGDAPDGGDSPDGGDDGGDGGDDGGDGLDIFQP